LNRLVSDLLRYARPINVQPQLVSMREVLERTLASSASTKKENAHAELVEVGTVPNIYGDANLLRQVFDNLVDNAIQAMNGAGTVTITIRGDSRSDVAGVSVAVQDTGEGMDTQVRSRAKDPFFTTRPSGTGLGLAIVDRIIERHGGELSIASNAGEGTTVTIFLPAAPPDESVLLFPVTRTNPPRKSAH
jgi:signal transduction histidine kinase